MPTIHPNDELLDTNLWASTAEPPEPDPNPPSPVPDPEPWKPPAVR